MSARRVNIARQDDDAVIPSTAYSKMIGGRCTHTECVIVSCCSFPLTSTAVVEAIGADVMPLKQKLEIIDTSNHIMEIIGTTKVYIENDVLGGRKCVEAAVTRSNKKEILKWDLVYDSFPHQTIRDYVYDKQRNKSLKAYSP